MPRSKYRVSNRWTWAQLFHPLLLKSGHICMSSQFLGLPSCHSRARGCRQDFTDGKTKGITVYPFVQNSGFDPRNRAEMVQLPREQSRVMDSQRMKNIYTHLPRASAKETIVIYARRWLIHELQRTQGANRSERETSVLPIKTWQTRAATYCRGQWTRDCYCPTVCPGPHCHGDDTELSTRWALKFSTGTRENTQRMILPPYWSKLKTVEVPHKTEENQHQYS